MYLALDLVHRILIIFNIRHVIGGDPTRIPKDSDSIVEHTHESHGGENEGVHDARRGHKTEPLVYENENSGKVYVRDDQNDDGHGQRESEAWLHCDCYGGTGVMKRRRLREIFKMNKKQQKSLEVGDGSVQFQTVR